MKTLAELKLKERDQAAIVASVRLLRQRFPVHELILFGSKARGSDDPESDIDLLVLTSRDLSWRERDAITDALFDVQLEHGVVISTLVVAGEDWRDGVARVLPIHDEVERDGVRL